MARFTKKRGQQIQDDIEKQERQYLSRCIDEGIQAGYEKIYDGDYAGLARIMRDILLDKMDVNRWSLRDHAEHVQDAAAELQWDYEAVRRFTEDPDTYVETLAGGAPTSQKEIAGELYMKAAGMSNTRERQRQTVINAFHSLESLAVARGFVSNSVTNFAPAIGYELQIGTWYQPPRDDMPFEIQLVDTGDSEEVTVNMGKPGRGKGVAGHTETEDRVHVGRKVIDLIDFDECEGGVLDIPMSNPTLREVREDMGLPADFTEHEEYEPPNVEIMVPLTNSLGEKYIPYHGDGATDTVVQPFTVPASRLSKRAMKRFISKELTPTQVEIFESAYDEIQRSRDDWNLHDLIMAVERHRGLHGNQGAVDRVQKSIRRIQQKGWIRDKNDPHSIDWERILTDRNTATIFTASLMDDTDEAAKYLFHSYVIYGFRTELKALKDLPPHVKEERGLDSIPKITSLARELHKVAPNNETAADDPTIREIQEAMTSDFRDLTAMHRHEGVELIADTQNFIGEIKRRARVNFNRACLFQVNFSAAKAMFEEVAGETRDDYPRRVTKRFGVGECAVLGRVGTGRPFEMTVSMAPPMSHHFDPDEWVNPERGITKSSDELKKQLGGDPGRLNPDGWYSVNSGWDLRVHLLDEEYRPAAELLDAVGADNPEQTDLETVKADQDPPEDGVGKFAWNALDLNPDGRVILDHLEMGYRAWAEQNGYTTEYTRQAVSQKFKNQPAPSEEHDTFGDLIEKSRPIIREHPDARKQTPVYLGVTLKDPSEWLDCCDAPEFELEWTGDPEDRTDRELSGWDCGNCGGDGPDQDPATDDMDCCDAPEPVPMYAGDERDEQAGWKCEACGEKEWF